MLEKKQRERRAQINQPVYIRDLIVTCQYDHFGEAKRNTNTYTAPERERLGLHIRTLFNLANEDHRANNCERNSDGYFQMKPGRENHVTRLSLSEFSLYTKKPLNLLEFHDLYAQIETMASEMEPNVHVLLSSFALLDDHNKLMNMSIFVEGGNPPTLHSFTKNTPALEEFNYGDRTLFSQQNEGEKASFESEGVVSETGFIISNGSVFDIKTAGGAHYTQTVDVCFDHYSEHSSELMKRRIFEEADPDEVIPDQIEQCVTSCSISVMDNSSIADYVVQADPLRKMHLTCRAALGEPVISDDAKARIIPFEYPSMAISNHASGSYKIQNPTFGSDCTVEILQNRKAAHFKHVLLRSLDEHNQLAFQRQELSAP